MREQPSFSPQQMAQRPYIDEPAYPILYLSSAEAGWEGLVAEAFHEPRELESWMAPTIPGVSLMLFTGGTMRMEIRHTNGPWKVVYMRQGDLSLRPGDQPPFELRWTSLSPAPTQTLHLHLSTSLLSRTAEEVGGFDPRRVSVISRSGFQDPLLAHIGLALWQELEQRSPAGKLYAETAAQMLAVHLLRHYTSAGRAIIEPAQRLTPKQMKRVMDYVQTYLSEDLSLESLAEQTGFSAYHFARLFRQTTGESPHQFVLRQRIERAQRLLKQTDMPLAQVAIESGFANQSHFTQAFKRYLGLTPRAYRLDCSI
jgi:AraC family transcriptional regulator